MGRQSPILRPAVARFERAALAHRWYVSANLGTHLTWLDVAPWKGVGLKARSADGAVTYVQIGFPDIVALSMKDDDVADVLTGQPDVLRVLAEKRSWAGAKMVASSYEVLTQATEGYIQERLGSRLFGEVYSSAEMCIPIGYRYADCQVVHVNSDAIHLEVTKSPSSASVIQQGAGRLIVTDLLDTTMPLLRYEIGDIGCVEGPDKCRCGRILPTVRVCGRTLEWVKGPLGVIPVAELQALIARQCETESCVIVTDSEARLWHRRSAADLALKQAEEISAATGISVSCEVVPNRWRALLDCPPVFVSRRVRNPVGLDGSAQLPTGWRAMGRRGLRSEIGGKWWNIFTSR